MVYNDMIAQDHMSVRKKSVVSIGTDLFLAWRIKHKVVLFDR